VRRIILYETSLIMTAVISEVSILWVQRLRMQLPATQLYIVGHKNVPLKSLTVTLVFVGQVRKMFVPRETGMNILQLFTIYLC